MARDEEREDGEEDEGSHVTPNGKPLRHHMEAQDEGSEEEEEEDEEPRLKYAPLTKHLKSVYQNEDATSSFMVAGDKMVIGSHHGNIHVLSMPSLKSIRTYRAHTASVSSLSMSPYPPPLAPMKTDASQKTTMNRTILPAPSSLKSTRDSPSARGANFPPVALTPSNLIHIGSASIDGNVCIQSLTDSRDVLLRSFGRPVQAVGLSPQFRSDRSYLTGGLAGLLVLTVGGQIGKQETATTTGAAAAASGWLGSIGLGSNAGKDRVLHSGEGAISTIKWSLSGKYVVWVNEQGIKIMRSNLYLDSAESEFAWKRISHTDHPNRPGWEEMAGIWKAHVEWIDEAGLESDDLFPTNGTAEDPLEPADIQRLKETKQSRRFEKLVVGWSGTIWIMNVHSGATAMAKNVIERSLGRAELTTILRIDCIISGISLYTPNLLLVLAYVTPEEDHSSTQRPTRRGVSRRQNALQPEMRIIDITTKEEISVADTLDISRYEGLSATDYHLGILPAIRIPKKTLSQRGTLETIGGGIEAIGGGIWDATMYPARLFGGGASVRSQSPNSSKPSSEANTTTNLVPAQTQDLPHPSTLSHGMKIFIHSPYDCIIATKPTVADHFSWLDNHLMFEEAWKLLDRNPEAVYSHSDVASEIVVDSPSKGSLIDFFADESSQTSSANRTLKPKAESEKRRIGDKWLQQLVSAQEWTTAGKVAGRVLGTSSRWEHWVRAFAQAHKYDEIAPFVPTEQAYPPLPSIVYELLLGHYISTNRPRFRELLERWSTDLFDADPIIEAIQIRFRSGEVSEETVEDEETGRDWRMLNESLAKLYLAVGTPRKALVCYIRLQDADAAMELIADSHLVDAVADDIPGFLLLRVNKEQQRSASLSELASLSLEPIRLLVSEAHYGTVLPEAVIDQLEARYGLPNPYLFFYFRALWNGDAIASTESKTITSAEERLLAQEGKTLVSDHADIAVSLFAEYDRSLLMTFLKSSQSYTLETASQICESRSYIPELVYLLSKEGRTAQALRLIIDSLGDVSGAITFAKEQNDASLWDDLLDYSMNKPIFIRGLLEEVGTSINPLKLVKRIPPGLEIEGLREGLGRMLREFEVQESISRGVARVLRSEVNATMQQQGDGLRKGIRIEVLQKKGEKRVSGGGTSGQVQMRDIKPGCCAGCGVGIGDHDPSRPPQRLLAFPCTHIFHLSCLLTATLPPDSEPPAVLSQFLDPTSSSDDEGGEHEMPPYERAIAPKVDQARLLRTVLDEGCPLEERHEGKG